MSATCDFVPNSAGCHASAVAAADRAEDLKELMEHWAKREARLFEPAGHDTSETGRLRSGLKLRPQLCHAVQHLRHLISHHDYTNGLPAALTLLDALCAKAASDTSRPLAVQLLDSVGLPATLGAVARAVLKCGGAAPCSNGDFLGYEEMCQRFLDLGQEPPRAGAILYAEGRIMTGLDGLVAPASPLEWAQAVHERLELLARLRQHPLQPLLHREVLAHVSSSATLLTERVSASPLLPPKALALGACAMGLTAAGVLPSTAWRPADASDAAWKVSIFSRMGQGRSRQGELGERGVELVAEAACCGVEELRGAAFRAAEAFQGTLGPAAGGAGQ